MRRGHDDAAGLKQSVTKRERASLLRLQYPLLFPLFLLGCALIAGYAAIAEENVFPGLTLIGVSTISLCLSIALITGISGILTSIIGIIEVIDRQSFRAAMFPNAKTLDLFGFSMYNPSKRELPGLRRNIDPLEDTEKKEQKPC